MDEIIHYTGSMGLKSLSAKRVPKGIPRRVLTEMVPEDMWERHRQIARLILLGYTNNQIADEIGMDRPAVCKLRNSPVIQKHLATMEARADDEAIDIRTEITNYLPKCLETIQGVIEDPEASDRLRVDASFKMLGLGGYVPPKNINMKSVSAHLSGEDIAKIRQRAMEVGIVEEE